jgi:hypothetical protein
MMREIDLQHLDEAEIQGYREMLWQEGEAIVRNAPQLFIDSDVEGDGPAGFGSTLAFGSQSPFGESFYRELKPQYDTFIPENRQFCEEHGLERERLLTEGTDLREAFHDFYSWLSDLRQTYGKQPVFTAFNAGYDWAHVDLGFAKSGLENPFGVAPFDIKSLFIAINNEWDWSKTTKSKLPKIIVPPEEFTHNAIEDAQWQQKLHYGAAAYIGAQRHMAIARIQ